MVKEAQEGAMLRIGAPDDFALVEAQVERVIALPRPQLPEARTLPEERCGQLGALVSAAYRSGTSLPGAPAVAAP